FGGRRDVAGERFPHTRLQNRALRNREKPLGTSNHRTFQTRWTMPVHDESPLATWNPSGLPQPPSTGIILFRTCANQPTGPSRQDGRTPITTGFTDLPVLPARAGPWTGAHSTPFYGKYRREEG